VVKGCLFFDVRNRASPTFMNRSSITLYVSVEVAMTIARKMMKAGTGCKWASNAGMVT